jgi:hypothetical protein
MKKILPFLLFSLGVVTLGFSQENIPQTAISGFSEQHQPVQPASIFLFLEEGKNFVAAYFSFDKK